MMQKKTLSQFLRLPLDTACDVAKCFLTTLSSGLDADAAERPPIPGDRHHRQGDGKEIRQILQEDDLAVSAEGPREKVFVMPLIILHNICTFFYYWAY